MKQLTPHLHQMSLGIVNVFLLAHIARYVTLTPAEA